MSLFVLDSDVLTVHFHGNQAVRAHAATLKPTQLAVTIVSVEEFLTGWNSQIRRARTEQRLIRAYQSLQNAMSSFAEFKSYRSTIPRRPSISVSAHKRLGAVRMTCELRPSRCVTMPLSSPETFGISAGSKDSRLLIGLKSRQCRSTRI